MVRPRQKPKDWVAKTLQGRSNNDRSSDILLLSPHSPLGHQPTPISENAEVECGRSVQVQSKLWLCVYLPRLAIDALACDETQPLAVSEQHHGKVIIHTCNGKAQSYGIELAMPLASALALCQELKVFPRDQLAEQRRLNRLAALAFGFSDTVCLYTANSVVLEVKSSLRLFGGIRPLFKRLKQKLGRFGGEAVVSIAPTSRAALWLSRSDHSRFVFKQEDLISALRNLPISLLVSEKCRLKRLNRSGIGTVADLLRLPRDGVARRFGASLLSDLDMALAQQDEPLNLFYPGRYFSTSVELYLATDKVECLLSAASNLLAQLERFLDKRRAATQHIQCVLSHYQHPPTVIDVGSHCDMRQASQFQLLLEDHLQRTQWPAEVTEITIRCDQFDVFSPEQLDLFDTSVTDENRWWQLLERFRVRLGESALQQFYVHPDHRPEKAQSAIAFHGAVENTDLMPRPLWFLSSPEPLKISTNHLYWHGPLSLDANIECIEQGWWDGDDIRRDYCIAHNPAGSRLWIFQDIRSKRWFLHGLFG